MTRLFTRRLVAASAVLTAVLGLFVAPTAAQASGPAPSIRAMSRHLGNLDGTPSVRIYGQNFVNVRSIAVGSDRSTGFIVRSPRVIDTYLPPHFPGLRHIRVITASGSSAVTAAASLYRYVPPPTITALDTVAGPTTGGTRLVIHGHDLGYLTGVHLGSAAATQVVSVSSTEIRVTTPAHPEGLIHAIVATHFGSTQRTLADRFRYGAPAAARWSTPSEIDPVRSDDTVPAGLADVSCAAATTFCAAVDHNARWLVTADGTTWSAPARAVPPDAVSCVTAARCVAVGREYSSVYDRTSFAVPFNTIAPDASVADVSCPSATFCLAVGGYRVTSGDGSTWSAPSRPYDESIVSGSCWSAGECAVISDDDILYLHDGLWKKPVSLFSHLTQGDRFATIDCPDASTCLLGTKDGAVTRVTPGGIASTYRVLAGIGKLDCAAAVSCVALDGSGASSAVWDGTRWSAPASTPETIEAISCPADRHCVAVGNTTAATLAW